MPLIYKPIAAIPPAKRDKEGGTWFPALREQADPERHGRMTRRYRAEPERCMSGDAKAA